MATAAGSSPPPRPEAVRRGCSRAHLDTLAFQAPAFYEKRGYRVSGALPDFVAGHTRSFVWKRLIGSEASAGARPADRPESGEVVDRTPRTGTNPSRP